MTDSSPLAATGKPKALATIDVSAPAETTGAIALGFALVGFEMMRRGRKRRAAKVADAAASSTPAPPTVP